LVGRQEGHLACIRYGGWWRCALVTSPDGVAPIRMVGVSASVNLPLHHKVQKFSFGTGSPGWSRKKGRKMVVVWWWLSSQLQAGCGTCSELVECCVTKVNHIGALHSDLTLGTRWLTQMASAARRCGMTIQYCMSQPRHVLTALLLPSVTQVSDD